MTEQQPGSAAQGDAELHGAQQKPDAVPSTTIGTGSALAFGCIGLVIVLLVIALALRLWTGVW